jgi:GWxTD domain-containing protein
MVLCLFGLSGFSSQTEEEKARMAMEEEAEDYFKKWLEQDVIYIITDDERAVFKGLSTAEEKDQFIEQFWMRRDSDLTTARNEYREEHYRRIAYANANFGTGIPGWKTDRGRIYIMFGPPAETQYYSGGGHYQRKPWEGGGRTSTYPFELWRYRHIPGVGEDIEIEFVDRSWTGEFKMAMYPWEKDINLHVDGLGQTTAERLGLVQSYQRPGLHPGHLNNANYMTKYFGQRVKDQPFERLQQFFNLQRPPEIEQKELVTIVDTNISYEMLDFETIAYDIWVNEEGALVPITIDVPNRDLTFFEEGPVYKARIGLYGRITSLNGAVVREFEDRVVSVYRKEHLEKGRTLNSLYQKVVTLPPGRFKLELVIKDLTSGNVGTYAKSIHLKAPEDGTMTAGTVILARQLEPLGAFPEEPKTYVIGDVRVVPSVSREFKNSDQLGVYLQIYNPLLDSADFLPAVSVEYRVSRGDEVVARIVDEDGSSVVFHSPRRLVLAQKMKLLDVAEGRYQLTVKVDDSISGKSLMSGSEFRVVDRKSGG